MSRKKIKDTRERERKLLEGAESSCLLISPKAKDSIPFLFRQTPPWLTKFEPKTTWGFLSLLLKEIRQTAVHFIDTETLLISGIKCQTIAVCETVGLVLFMHKSSLLKWRYWLFFSSARSQCPLQCYQCWIYFSFQCLWKRYIGQRIHHTVTV